MRISIRHLILLSLALALFSAPRADGGTWCGDHMRILGHFFLSGSVSSSIHGVVKERLGESYREEDAQAWTDALRGLSRRDRLALYDQLVALRPGRPLDARTLLEAFTRAAKHPREPRLEYYYDVLTHSEELGGYPEAVVDAAFPAAKDAYDPYTRAYTVGDTHVGRLKAALDFHRLAAGGASTAEAKKAVSDWIDSPDRAVYAYRYLKAFGDGAKGVLDYLLEHNPEFKKATAVKGAPTAVITYSFDKETQKLAQVVRMYRPPEISEEKWLQMSDQERYDAVTERSPGRYTPAPHTSLTPTRENPGHLGGLQEEVPGRIFEVAHSSFEIDPNRLLQQMETLGKRLEAEGFHVHVVFELPKEYPDAKMRAFSDWVKQLNDFLYLRNVERGAFGESTIKVPEDAAPRGFFEKMFGSFSSHLPASLKDVTKESHKKFNAAVRAGIYGDSADPDHVRVAIELRDVASSISDWRRYMQTVSSGLTGRIWEQRGSNSGDRAKEIRLSQADVDGTTRELRSKGVGDAEWVAQAEPMATLPFRDFENALFYDYQKQAYRKPTEEESRRIVEARDAYLAELKAIYRANNRNSSSRSGLNPIALRQQVRTALYHWARKARLSELYSGL